MKGPSPDDNHIVLNPNIDEVAEHALSVGTEEAKPSPAPIADSN
jgi:hypothetical protein